MAQHNPRFIFAFWRGNLVKLCVFSFFFVERNHLCGEKQKENELYHDNDYIQLPLSTSLSLSVSP